MSARKFAHHVGERLQQPHQRALASLLTIALLVSLIAPLLSFPAQSEADDAWTTSYDTAPAYVNGFALDSSNGVLYAAVQYPIGGGGGVIYRCVTSTGCDAASDWTVSYDMFLVAAPYSIVINTTHNVLYVGGSYGMIFRCALSTGCDASSDWTTSYDSSESTINTLIFVTPTNYTAAPGVDVGFIYAGTGTGGIIYRCDISTNCDAAGDWTTSYNTPAGNIQSFVFDAPNNVIYAGSNNGGIIYRCATSTNCDAAADWTTSTDNPLSTVNSLAIDTDNNVIYAGSGTDGVIYRCATSTNCDSGGDWTISYDTPANYIYALTFDTVNDVLYAGTNSGGIIYRCVTSTGCDAASDWTVSYDSTELDVLSIGFDATNNILYAGSGASGIIYRLDTDPVTAPTAPTSLDAVAGTGNISLSWVTPASNGGSAITNYKIYKGTTPAPVTLASTTGVVTSYVDYAVATGTTYYYRVTATNAVGDSAYSNEDSALITNPPAQCALSAGGTPITGYAWSDTIGWIDMSCENSGVCATSDFGLAIANDGTISGCAWSENVGWVSAAAVDLTGCPSGTCTARMNELALEGWLKVASANDAQSGGWDGFISLSGSSPDYGPTLASSTLSGYAWGDVNVGWINFNSGTSYNPPVETEWVPTCATQYSCVSPTARQSSCTNAPVEPCGGSLICSAGACVNPPAPYTPPGSELKVSPNLVGYQQTVTVSWNVQEADSCTVTENNPDFVDSWDALTGSETSSPITRITTYTLSCTGPGGDLTQTATVSRKPDWREI